MSRASNLAHSSCGPLCGFFGRPAWSAAACLAALGLLPGLLAGTPPMADAPSGSSKFVVPVATDELAEAELTAKLQRPIQCNIPEGTPLKEALGILAEAGQVQLVLDYAALESAGTETEADVGGLQLNQIKLGNAFKLVLTPLALVYTYEAGVLKITTEEDDDEDNLFTRVYNVADLLQDPFAPSQNMAPGALAGGKEANSAARVSQVSSGGLSFERPGPWGRTEQGLIGSDATSLIELITTVVRPDSWDLTGGSGSYYQFGTDLTLRQTRYAHEDIQALLAELRACRQGQAPLFAWMRDPKPELLKEALAASDFTPRLVHGAENAHIVAALEQRGDFSATEGTTLKTWLKAVSQQCEIPIVLESHALETAGTDPDEQISVQLLQVPLHEALQVALDPLELTFVPQHQVLRVTTKEVADEERLLLAVYPVTDLVAGFTTEYVQKDSPDGSKKEGRLEIVPSYGDSTGLVETIVATTEPDSWEEVGGKGSLNADQLDSGFGIAQTYTNHRNLAALLQRLREHASGESILASHKRAQAQLVQVVTEVYPLLPPAEAKTEPSRIAELMRNSVAPEFWANAPSNCYVEVHGEKLVVAAPPAIQRQVKRYLILFAPNNTPSGLGKLEEGSGRTKRGSGETGRGGGGCGGFSSVN